MSDLCDHCGDTHPVRHAKMVERDGRVAIITDIPAYECSTCGTRWLTAEVAVALDQQLRHLLASNTEECSHARYSHP